jgi:hypothetical protein
MGNMIDYMGLLLWEVKVDQERRSVPHDPDHVVATEPDRVKSLWQRVERLMQRVGSRLVSLDGNLGRERARAVEVLIKEREQRGVHS